MHSQELSICHVCATAISSCCDHHDSSGSNHAMNSCKAGAKSDMAPSTTFDYAPVSSLRGWRLRKVYKVLAVTVCFDAPARISGSRSRGARGQDPPLFHRARRQSTPWSACHVDQLDSSPTNVVSRAVGKRRDDLSRPGDLFCLRAHIDIPKIMASSGGVGANKRSLGSIPTSPPTNFERLFGLSPLLSRNGWTSPQMCTETSKYCETLVAGRQPTEWKTSFATRRRHRRVCQGRKHQRVMEP